MDRRIILLSGSVASGKSTLARSLADRFDMRLLRTSDLLKHRITGTDLFGRDTLQSMGDRLDRETKGRWVLDGLARELRGLDGQRSIVVDAVRIPEQIVAIREAYGPIVTHIHMTAQIRVLTERYEARQSSSQNSDSLTYEDVRSNDTERLIDRLGEVADVVIDSDLCNANDVLIRAASHLRLYNGQSTGYADVIIGGQYGSEGKGQIAHFLAEEYDLLVRVGGPNAGHKVFERPKPFTHHQLPSGTRRNTDAKILIGPGAVINVEKLLEEIAECKIEFNRLNIDRRAMIIQDADFDDEKSLVAGIGSTGQGVGSATSRRIMNRDCHTRLAKHIPELAPYMCDAYEVLSEVYSSNGRICLEGTQGTGLSLYHGEYPYVTSRDTTVSGCLAEAGIPPSWVRRIVMVCRTYPIRVESPEGNTSGPMSQEICLETVSERSGIALDELEETERTSTTDRKRRIAEFDWNLLRKASILNAPTDIALTFTDYLSIKNREARRFDQLQSDTIKFIQEVERISGARISLITTGFNSRSVIDRRSW